MSLLEKIRIIYFRPFLQIDRASYIRVIGEKVTQSGKTRERKGG